MSRGNRVIGDAWWGLGGAGRRLLQWSTCRCRGSHLLACTLCCPPWTKGGLCHQHNTEGIAYRFGIRFLKHAVASIWLPSSRLLTPGGREPLCGKKAHLAQTTASHPCPVKEPASGSSAHKPPETQPHKKTQASEPSMAAPGFLIFQKLW